jgi:hypothetical protein
MAIRPSRTADTVLKGRFSFNARHSSAGTIADGFDLKIVLPRRFPLELPSVTETGGRIPKKADHHVNETDGTLCLGSPLSLLKLLAGEPTLPGFAGRCLIPYLYAVSHKLAHGGKFLFGELDHGEPGMIADYLELLGLHTLRQVREAIRLLGMKKRLANKQQCPCGCSLRVGSCKFNFRLREFRAFASRAWYRKHLEMLPMPPKPQPSTLPKKRRSYVVL